MVTTETPGHAVSVDVPLDGARYLALVVDDGGDGFSCDWADWMEPRLVGPAGELKLTDLKWKSAATGWGEVRVDQNVGGGPLRVHGEPVAYGIGTHSASLIEYELPEGYERFVARVGIDNGGSDQAGPPSSVRFLVYTQRPRLAAGGGPDREPEVAVDHLDVHPSLKASLFAAEPLLMSPASIDVDHRGRVWVCEVINYRGHAGKRVEGDRILILEDTDEDGEVDATKVFYQGRDIDSPHGVCVLGNRVIVSAGSQVLCLIDDNGDDQADRKEVWFSGIAGTQHDHGIHAFMFGPDGKLYFNFGNEGKQLLDPDGKPVVDLDGKVVSEGTKPYQQGMIFRCNLDRSQVETLAWNFRNNWMVTVDSFGTLWQSDNDDDGNRGVRINYVMPFGNYGYRDEVTGAGWQSPRTGMSPDMQRRQWHQDDPGVVPNLLLTGAGAPTGIMVYEGNALPEFLHGQLIHCDAGPSVTRAYPVVEDGAGYRAEMVNLLHGARDAWFRPSDVRTAPDGSLIVADWYDPGVGGHAMGDLERGRLFRLASQEAPSTYRMPKFDLTTVAGAVQALKNPNNEARYLAWQALRAMGARAIPGVKAMAEDGNPVYRARALWLMGNLPGQEAAAVETAAADRDARIRCQAIRLAKELNAGQLAGVDAIAWAERLADDTSPAVRRECALALRHVQDPRVPAIWARLARAYDGRDRWYLEALGIGADQQWDACLAAWMQGQSTKPWTTAAGRDLLWRSRAQATPDLLRQVLLDPATTAEDAPRYLRALDFLAEQRRQEVVRDLAFQAPSEDAKGQMILAESLARLDADWLRAHPDDREAVDRLVGSVDDSTRRIALIGRLGLEGRYQEVVALACSQPDSAEGVEAVRLLLAANQQDRLSEVFHAGDAATDDAGPMEWTDAQRNLLRVLKNSADNRAVPVLVGLLGNDRYSSEQRREVLDALANIRGGAEYLVERAEKKEIPAESLQAVAAALQLVPWNDLRDRASGLLPVMASARADRLLPGLKTLAERRGDAENGALVFRTTGTCAKCHVVRQEGKAVGPELSEIGKKLSREAMFESILYPSAGISHSFETYTAELNDGNVVTGILVSQSTEAVEIKNAEGLSRRIPRSEIEQLVKQPISMMPADLYRNLTEEELVDLVEYLGTLK